MKLSILSVFVVLLCLTLVFDSVSGFLSLGSRSEEFVGCNGRTAVLRQSDGVLTSPNFGSRRDYPNRAKCSWRIVVDKSLKVLLQFEKFSLEPGSDRDVCYDALSVYDGPSPASPLFGSFCGLRVPSDIMSRGNEIYLEFTSNSRRSAPGFLINYSAKDISSSAFTCGVPDVLPKTYSRIIGGVEATPHSWPWLVQIEIVYKSRWQFWCGGSILYPQWIVAAAHCAYSDLGRATSFRVTLGDHDMFNNDGMEQIVQSTEFYIHENYDDLTNDNDILLIRLPKALKYNHYIKPICLPETDVKENTLCIVAGWGKTMGTGNAGVLNQLAVPIISRKQCNQPDWYDGRVSDNMICAGYPDGFRDSCQGDSGGPLVCQSEGTWVMSGITSFGEGCALAKHPGVYTRVTNYLEWIKGVTGM